MPSLGVNHILITLMHITDGFPGYPVTKFIPDTTSPVLNSFSIDLTDGTLIFTFSEPVSITSFQPRQITLHSNSNINSTYLSNSSLIVLSGGYTNSLNGRILILFFSSTDLNNIKESTFIKDRESTYLSITTNMITDLALIPNFVVEISPFYPIQ
ncbi:hypothetical protein LOD99_2128, partial [Oopsacas minuta]